MRVLSPLTACTITSPPRPPSPPLGPPNSMNFSRRNATQPFPPSPERMKTLASSRNFMELPLRSLNHYRAQEYIAASPDLALGTAESTAEWRDICSLPLLLAAGAFGADPPRAGDSERG